MFELPPELATFLVSLGILNFNEIKELSLTSKNVYKMLFGNEYTKSRIYALNGFTWVCMHGTALDVEFFLKQAECDPTVYDSVCLRIAARYNPEALGVLLKDGRADPTDLGSECLNIAAQYQPKAVKLLLKDGRADPDETGCLETAVCRQSEAVRYLLKDGRTCPSDLDVEILSTYVVGNSKMQDYFYEDGRVDPCYFT